MVRGRRLIRAALGVTGILALVATAILGTRAGQTWLVQRALACRPDWQASVAWVHFGWGSAELGDLSWRKGPIQVRVPAAKIDYAVGPLLFSGQWKLETVLISAVEVLVTEPVEPLLPTVGGGLESIARGFGSWELPLAIDVGRIEVAGTVRAPGWPAAAALQVRGGNLGVGREAKFEIAVQTETGDAAVAKLGASGILTLRLRSVRRPDRLAFEGEVKAEGKRWPRPVRVSLALSASDHGSYQDYRGTCWTDERPLMAWDARMTDAAVGAPARMNGTWMLDVREGDLAPLFPGAPLAAVMLRSDGRFAAAEPFSGFDFEGSWQAACAHPRAIWPQWRSDRSARLEGRFQVRQSSETSHVRALAATLTAGDARATLAIGREFAVRWPGGARFDSDATAELGTVELRHWPWALLPAELSAAEPVAVGAVNGRLVFSPRPRGWSLRSEGDLSTDPQTLVWANTEVSPEVRAQADVSLQWLTDGWQLEARRLALSGPKGEFARGEFKAGRLNASGQPLKLAGKFTLDFARVENSGANPLSGWRSGQVTADVAASLGTVRGWRVQVESRGGVVHSEAGEIKVPALHVDARLETDATGRLAFDFPLVLSEGATTRDVRIAGTVRADAAGDKWDASVSAPRVQAEDLALLAALGGLDEGRLSRLLHWDGRIGLRFGRVELPAKAELQGFEAELVARQSVGALSVKSAWSAGGQIALSATLRPEAGSVRAAGEGSVLQMRAADLWRLAGLAGVAPLEGGCDGSLRFDGPLTSPLAHRAELELVSRGGVFHGLPVSFVRVAESTNRLTSWISSAGLAFNALTGRSTEAEIAGRSQAVAELVRGLNPVNCDQFTVRAERGPAGDWRVRELALIAPELRVLGEGTVGTRAGQAASLALELQLRARGRTAELLQYLGVLQDQRDSLGYAGCALPVRLTGALARPDATELNQRLAALSVEKPGMVEKALEFLGRWRGPGADGAVKP